MAKRERDANEDAADVVRRATRAQDELPADVEATWADWSKRINGVDERTMTLLRAAFEAGADAGGKAAGKATSRRGGFKGGKARAASLSAKRRAEIARKAAKTRWAKGQG